MSNGEPTARQLERDFTRLTTELAALRTQFSHDYVLAKVFDVVFGALADRVKSLEGERDAERERAKENRATMRRTKAVAVITSAAAVVGAIISAVVTAQIGR